jgi:hypothetical protein
MSGLALAQSIEQQTPQSETQWKHQEIAELAYALWQRRGCPERSAEHDWREAEETVRLLTAPQNARNI